MWRSGSITHFQCLVYSSNFDVICMTETWLTSFIYDHEILPSKFILYRSDRESRGDSVLIAVNNLIPYILIPSPSNLEVVTVSVHLPGYSICLCVVYCPPNSEVSYFLSVSKSAILISDHLQITFDLSLTPSPSSTKRQESLAFYNYANADFEGLCDSLLESDLNSCLQSDCIEQAWTFIKDIIHNAMDRFIPKIQLNSVANPKWFTSEIHHTIKCLQTQEKKYALYPTADNLSKLHSLQHQLKVLTSSEKLRFEQDLAKKPPARIFKY